MTIDSMKIIQVVGVVMVLMLSACKVVNHHTVKLTGSATIQGNEIHLPITTGNVYLATKNMTEKQQEILRSILPFQCITITTTEPFNMQSREIHFQDFKVKKLPIGDSACRKIKVRTQISGRV